MFRVFRPGHVLLPDLSISLHVPALMFDLSSTASLLSSFQFSPKHLTMNIAADDDLSLLGAVNSDFSKFCDENPELSQQMLRKYAETHRQYGQTYIPLLISRPHRTYLLILPQTQRSE